MRRRPTAHVNHWTTTPHGVTLGRSRWEGQAIFHLDIQLSRRKMLRVTPATGAIAAHRAPGKCLPPPASTVSQGNQTFGASPPSTSLHGDLASAIHIIHPQRWLHSNDYLASWPRMDRRSVTSLQVFKVIFFSPKFGIRSISPTSFEKKFKEILKIIQKCQLGVVSG